MSLRSVAANAVLVRLCPSRVPQELIIIIICMRSSHLGFTYPVAYSIVMRMLLAVRIVCIRVSDWQ